MWPRSGEGTPGSTPKREASRKGRPEGHWGGSNTWGPSPRTKQRVTSSSAKGASCLTSQMKLVGALSPPCPTEELDTSEVGFEESWQEYPILKIPPSCPHPKNTSATNFPHSAILPFPLQSWLVCLLPAPWGGTSTALPAGPCICPLSPGKLEAPLGEWDMGSLHIAGKGELELGAKGKPG